MAVIPLKHQDISRIIDAFDQDNFKAPPLKSLPYARQLIVINQLERSLYLTFPAEIIDKIVRPFIESSPSIKILWMHFIGSPVIASKYNYPLASNTFLNSASKILLLKLGKTPSAEKEDLACFKQLMTEVFKHYFHKLSQPQKLELLQKCYITPWEQRSPEQQLVLLGRVQHLSGWGHPKIKLQFLSWKIRFAAARNLNNKVLKRIILAPLVIFFVLGSGILVLYLFHVINEGIFQNKKIENFLGQGVKTLAGGLLIHMICTLGVSVGGSVVSLFFAALGTILKNRSLPSHIQEKGEWIQRFSLNYCYLSWNCALMFASFLGRSKNAYQDYLDRNQFQANITEAFDEIKMLLTEAINDANIGIEQEKFLEAQLPDLLEKWHLRISQIYRLN